VQEALAEQGRGLPQFAWFEDAEGGLERGELAGVPVGLVGGRGEAAVLGGDRFEVARAAFGTDRLEVTQAARDPLGDRGGRRVDDDLHPVLPAFGQMLLESPDGVEAGRRGEGVREDVGGDDPVDAEDSSGVLRVRPAQQEPPAVAHDDGPRVDLHDAFVSGLASLSRLSGAHAVAES
jgi:hypothetical protein